MDRTVTYREFLDLRAWMAQTFITRVAFSLLEGDVNRIKLEVSELKRQSEEHLTEFRAFKDSTLTAFDNALFRLERLEQEHAVMIAHMTAFEKRLEVIENRLDIIETDIAALKTDMVEVKSGLAAHREMLVRIEEKLDRLGKAS